MTSRDAEFTAFLEDHSVELMSLGYLLTRNEADAADLVQEALVRVWSRRDGPEIENLGAYVRAAMVHRHVSQCRRDDRWRRLRHRFVGADRSPPPDQEIAARDQLARALDDLSPMQRAAFCLQLFEDLTVVEIAATLGCSPGGAKRHLFEARRRLAASLAPGETTHDHR